MQEIVFKFVLKVLLSDFVWHWKTFLWTRKLMCKEACCLRSSRFHLWFEKHNDLNGITCKAPKKKLSVIPRFWKLRSVASFFSRELYKHKISALRQKRKNGHFIRVGSWRNNWVQRGRRGSIRGRNWRQIFSPTIVKNQGDNQAVKVLVTPVRSGI